MGPIRNNRILADVRTHVSALDQSRTKPESKTRKQQDPKTGPDRTPVASNRRSDHADRQEDQRKRQRTRRYWVCPIIPSLSCRKFAVESVHRFMSPLSLHTSRTLQAGTFGAMHRLHICPDEAEVSPPAF